MPNAAGFAMRLRNKNAENEPWHATPQIMNLTLLPGANIFEACATNTFGRATKPLKIILRAPMQ